MQSGYTFRTRAILREQRRVGWETFHLTSPKHTVPGPSQEDVDGLHFYRTAPPRGATSPIPGLGEIALMRAWHAAWLTSRGSPGPTSCTRTHPCSTRCRHCGLAGASVYPSSTRCARSGRTRRSTGTSRQGGLRYRLSRALETFALRRADHVTTICDGLKREIVARGIAESRVTIIPNAVDVDAFEFGGDPDLALKEQLGLAERRLSASSDPSTPTRASIFCSPHCRRSTRACLTREYFSSAVGRKRRR